MLLAHLIRQKPYEHIVEKIRRSIVTLIPYVFGLIILLLLPLALRWLVDRLFPGLLNGEVLGPIGLLLVSLYYLSCVLFFYSYFVDFYVDVVIITNDRLIDINQNGLFSHTILEVDLYQITDATSKTEGAFATLFHYGDVYIETAGAGQKRIAESVPHPDRLRRQILDLASEDRRYHNK